MTLLNNKIVDFVQKIKDFSKTNLVNSEENTKKRIIDPLIEMLGWDLKDLQLEYPISMGHSTYRVDYAMIDKGKPVMLLEAKPFSNKLSESDSAQIISYGKVEDVRWVALTNGNVVKVFDTEAGKAEDECLVDEIDLLKLSSNFSELMGLLSKSSILAGKVDIIAKKLKEKRKIINFVNQNKDVIAQKFKDSLIKIIGTEIKDKAEAISKKLADVAAQLLTEELEQTKNGIIKEISREELKAKPDGEIILCSSRIDGIDFLKKYNAWGYVRTNKKVPYFALYVGKPESAILYFGEVDSIIGPIKSKDEIDFIEEKDKSTFKPGTSLIRLKPESLIKFKDPIPLKNKRNGLRNIKYTKLSKLIKAKYLEDV